MALQITQANRIEIDNEYTGLCVTQRREGTVVYTPEFEDRKYKEHKMPHVRYSLAHPKPASGAAGSEQFEADIKALLKELHG